MKEVIKVRVQAKRMKSFDEKLEFVKQEFGRFGSLVLIQTGFEGTTMYQVFHLTLP